MVTVIIKESLSTVQAQTPALCRAVLNCVQRVGETVTARLKLKTVPALYCGLFPALVGVKYECGCK